MVICSCIVNWFSLAYKFVPFVREVTKSLASLKPINSFSTSKETSEAKHSSWSVLNWFTGYNKGNGMTSNLSELEGYISGTPKMKALVVSLEDQETVEVQEDRKIDNEALNTKRLTVSKYSSVAGFMEFDPKHAAQSNRNSVIKNRRVNFFSMTTRM
jgi:hypothetical protein